jgi:nitronate monooxygenase
MDAESQPHWPWVLQGRRLVQPTEARISTYHRAAIKSARDNRSAITNVLTGRPARGFVNRIVAELGPLATGVPSFPLLVAALALLRTKAESEGSADFSALYAGQAAALCR